MSLSVSVDVTRFLSKLEKGIDVVWQEAEVFAQQAAEVGVEAAKVKLDLAETPYGRYRFNEKSQGRSAGRNDTGTMMDALSVLEPEVTSDSVAVSFGWDENDMQKYFEVQELGLAGIEAADSLGDGAMAVEAELPRLAKNMLQRIRRKI